MDIGELEIDYLISSSNKSIQGVPGFEFGFVIARGDVLAQYGGNAHSLSLDLYRQWQAMDKSGKWRFTSPTHVVRSFYQALDELDAEGGIATWAVRYQENHRILVDGIARVGIPNLALRRVASAN